MIKKFRVTHGWETSNHKWAVALEGYGVIETENEESYREVIKDNYIEIEIDDYSPTYDDVLQLERG